MGSCKECYHYEVCRMHYQQKCELTYETEKEVRHAMLEAKKGSPICEHFKDRSRFVELPCKVGDTVYSVHGHPDYGYKIEALQAQDVALICSSGELSYSKRLNYFGKTVFLTREEAEKALNEREENA